MHIILKLNATDDTKPQRLVNKEEVFAYMDNLFGFYSQPRSDVDYLMLYLYMSKIRNSIISSGTDSPLEDDLGIPPSGESDLSGSNCIVEQPAVSQHVIPNSETVRNKRLEALETRTFVPETLVHAVEPKEVVNKTDKYRGLMKLPVWASDRTRQLRAEMLGLSIDEV